MHIDTLCMYPYICVCVLISYMLLTYTAKSSCVSVLTVGMGRQWWGEWHHKDDIDQHEDESESKMVRITTRMQKERNIFLREFQWWWRYSTRTQLKKSCDDTTSKQQVIIHMWNRSIRSHLILTSSHLRYTFTHSYTVLLILNSTPSAISIPSSHTLERLNSSHRETQLKHSSLRVTSCRPRRKEHSYLLKILTCVCNQ